MPDSRAQHRRNNYQYNPTGTPWTFAGNSGISGAASAFNNNEGNVPEGTQIAFLQFANSSISQNVSLSAGTYLISFYAATTPGQSAEF